MNHMILLHGAQGESVYLSIDDLEVIYETETAHHGIFIGS